jgi:hypothetical protein
MANIKTEQVDSNILQSVDFDLVLAASGYESRSTFLFTKSKLKSSNKFVINFESYKNDSIRIYNDNIFEKLGFKSWNECGDKFDSILNKLDLILKAISKKQIKVLIDYSCMTRVWYAEILRYFSYIENFAKIELYFSYSVSKFVDPPQNSPINKFVAPINGFYSISVPMKPTALIIGLGYVSSRAFGLAEYFDVKPFLFINDHNFNLDFHNEVISQNNDLIKSVSEENIFYYPLNNLSYTETLLNHLCTDLLNDYRVILAPCGPKPFTLLSLITSLRLNNVDVWRISAGENETPIDKQANGTLLVLKCMIENARN